jgi:GH25 family lysozyme M1 (1,4-beta-N-acetylmuramidase)
MRQVRRRALLALAAGASTAAMAGSMPPLGAATPQAGLGPHFLHVAPGQPLAPKPGAVPAPPGQAPGCGVTEQMRAGNGNGYAGLCAPRAPRGAPSRPPRGASASQTGPDTSHYDPVYEWAPVKAHGHRFAWAKLTEGTGWVDGTAAAQVAGMRRAGIVAGGYDLFRVCEANPLLEARAFTKRLRALGLASTGSLLPMGDAEEPGSVPCSTAEARAWIWSWMQEMHRMTGRWPGIYTGAWWWNPEIGCWWPPHAVSWISGYRPYPPYLPCRLPHLDVWQYTDRGFNGITLSDMSVLYVPLAALSEPTRRELQERLWHDYRYRNALRLQLTFHHCRRPPWPRPVPDTPGFLHACGVWRDEGRAVNAEIRDLHRKGFF